MYGPDTSVDVEGAGSSVHYLWLKGTWQGWRADGQPSLFDFCTLLDEFEHSLPFADMLPYHPIMALQ